MTQIYKFQKNITFILLFILFFIFIEGFLCRPAIGPSLHLECQLQFYDTDWNEINPPIFCKYGFCKEIFFYNFWQENGFVENLQTIILLFAIFFLVIARSKSNTKILNIFLIFKIIALFYFLGEEISWGQHFFNWSSPDWFLENNNQKETNIHNINNIFDQLPRSLVLFWCTLIPLIFKFSQNFISINKNLSTIILPNPKLIIFSFLILFFVLPDLIVDKLRFHPNEQIIFDKELGYLFDMLTFNFLKLSEFQELLFCYYFIFYSMCINNIKFNGQETQ